MALKESDGLCQINREDIYQRLERLSVIRSLLSIIMHDALLAQLAKLGDIKVISRTSVLEYADSPKNMRQIGEELGVTTILEGSVLRSGDALQINVQLIDAQTDEHLWAEIYDRELTAENGFAIQREMATSIAGALRATLSPEEVERLNAVPTENTRAWSFYLSGLDYQGPRSDNRLAIQQLTRAVEEDPEFALAWAALGESHNDELRERDRTESRRRNALEAIQRALELEPDLSEAHLAMGSYHVAANRDYPRALLELAIAEQGMPGDVRIYRRRALTYDRMGDFDREAAAWERVIELDPRETDALFRLAFAHSNRRDYARHEQYLDRYLEMVPDDADAYRSKVRTPMFRDGDVSLVKAAAENPPIDLGDHRSHLGWEASLYERDYDTALRYLDNWRIEGWYGRRPKASYYGMIYRLAEQAELAEQHFQTARAEISAVLEESPESYFALVALGEVLAGLGETEEALAAVRRAFELMPRERDAFRGPLTQLEGTMRVLAVAGDDDATLAALDEYLSGPGHWSIEGLLPDPNLDNIRDDPRFQALVEKYRRR